MKDASSHGGPSDRLEKALHHLSCLSERDPLRWREVLDIDPPFLPHLSHRESVPLDALGRFRIHLFGHQGSERNAKTAVQLPDHRKGKGPLPCQDLAGLAPGPEKRSQVFWQQAELIHPKPDRGDGTWRRKRKCASLVVSQQQREHFVFAAFSGVCDWISLRERADTIKDFAVLWVGLDDGDHEPSGVTPRV